MKDEKLLKYVLVFSGLALIAGVTVYFITKNKNNNDEEGDEEMPDPSKLTKIILWYQNSANEIFNALNGFGTDEQTLFDIMSQLETQADYDKLTESYGKKTGKSGIKAFTGDLKQWIKEEFDKDELRQITDILTSKNIAF